MAGPHGFFCTCKACNKEHSQIGSTLPKKRRRNRPIGKESYGVGDYSDSSFSSATKGTYDGYPSLTKRRDDGALEIYYGPKETLSPDNRAHGHVVIKDGRIVYKRRPGEEHAIINTGE